MLSEEGIPFLAFLPLVLLVGYIDLRTLKIPNAAVLAGAMLFLLTSPLLSMEEAIVRAGISAASFAICFGCFWFGLMGGGDAKFLPVVFLFVPSSEISLFMLCLAFGLAVCILGIVQVRARWGETMEGWASLQRPGAVPVGFALAIASLAFVLVGGSIT
jgi:prepilin peptidase CpaA